MNTLSAFIKGQANRGKYEHDAGKCGAMCGYCYHEACEWLAANEAANV